MREPVLATRLRCSICGRPRGLPRELAAGYEVCPGPRSRACYAAGYAHLRGDRRMRDDLEAHGVEILRIGYSSRARVAMISPMVSLEVIPYLPADEAALRDRLLRAWKALDDAGVLKVEFESHGAARTHAWTALLAAGVVEVPKWT